MVFALGHRTLIRSNGGHRAGRQGLFLYVLFQTVDELRVCTGLLVCDLHPVKIVFPFFAHK